MGILSSLAEMFSMVGTVFSAVLSVWFIIFPPLLWFVFKLLWMYYVNGEYASKIKWVLLELIPPRDIEKSPQPMESIFNGFAGVIKSPTTAEVWIKGEFPVSFSLEIVSLEGKVHFYVRTEPGFRNLVEAQFYAHYPNIEIVEVPDYVHLVPKTIPNAEWDLWGTDFDFAKPDLYPIRTYKHFEESVTGTMIDPLASVVETMGKIGPGQYLWFQMLVQPYTEKWYSEGKKTIDEFLGKEEKKEIGILHRIFLDFWDILANLTNGMFGREFEFSAGKAEEKKDEAPVEFRLTPGEKDVLKALQENLAKQQFKTRVRHVYIGRSDVFKKTLGVSAFIGSIKQFNDFNLNSLKPNDGSKTYANYLFTKPRLRYRQRRILRRYIDRDPTPFGTLVYLSAEELATLFHMPDMSVMSPSVERVSAKTGGAPANLPVLEE